MPQVGLFSNEPRSVGKVMHPVLILDYLTHALLVIDNGEHGSRNESVCVGIDQYLIFDCKIPSLICVTALREENRNFLC